MYKQIHAHTHTHVYLHFKGKLIPHSMATLTKNGGGSKPSHHCDNKEREREREIKDMMAREVLPKGTAQYDSPPALTSLHQILFNIENIFHLSLQNKLP